MKARPSLEARLADLDWPALEADLDERGYARAGPLLTPAECERLIALWEERERFRSHVDLERHGFGRGAYRYFARPLPPTVETLRKELYPPLARIANRWQARLGGDERFPRTLRAFLERCRRAGQERPTPLVLRYGAGDYNCLHQDLYGEVAFPLQAALLLSDPSDFRGGEFLLVEQRPRRQSRGHAIALERGEAVLFPNAARPVTGTRGFYRAHHRHGVSDITSGTRLTLGIIFHDAR